MTALGLVGRGAVVPTGVLTGLRVVLLEPGHVHRTRVDRLKPRPAERWGGQREREGEQLGVPQKSDHRRLSYVSELWRERG